MKLIKEIRENAAILTLKGDFDSFVCGPFMAEIQELLKNGIKYLITDMRLVLFINSTAIGTLVKTHKEVKKNGGSLMICRPSKFVANVLDTLGLMSFFKVGDDPEKALEQIGASGEGMDMGADSSVIIHIPGSGKETCIGKIASLEEDSITLRIPERREELLEGVECKIKFRLPLFRKGHYFEADVAIAESVHSTTDVQLKCNFKNIADEDRKSIAQFVEEMKFLRSEARDKQ